MSIRAGAIVAAADRAPVSGADWPTLPSCAPRCGRRRASYTPKLPTWTRARRPRLATWRTNCKRRRWGGVWPETLAVLREADPEGAEALATAADAFDRAIERAPDPESEPEPPPDPLAGLPPMARVEALGRLLGAATKRS